MTSHIIPIMQTAVEPSSPISIPPIATSRIDDAVQGSSPRLVRGTSVKLSVPLDHKPVSPPSRKLLRRDSLDRREAFLKGKEGSRQRRRWENDRLLNNPHAEPPLPQDWEIRPTYPVRRVPYYLAPLWDAAEFQRAVEAHSKGRRNTRSSRRKHPTLGVSPFEEDAINISRDVRSRLKHARSAKGLLQDLEDDVREFLVKWNERECRLRSEGLHDAPLACELPVRSKPAKALADSALVSDTEGEEEEEEIVFIGRTATNNVTISDSPTRKRLEAEENLLSEKLVCEGYENDKGAAFGRWLAHCIGSYYGLRTWSVTTDGMLIADTGIDLIGQQFAGEKVRQAYVGIDARVRGWMGQGWESGREFELPRPLYATV